MFDNKIFSKAVIAFAVAAFFVLRGTLFLNEFFMRSYVRNAMLLLNC